MGQLSTALTPPADRENPLKPARFKQTPTQIAPEVSQSTPFWAVDENQLDPEPSLGQQSNHLKEGNSGVT
jgi:hypothetical protein